MSDSEEKSARRTRRSVKVRKAPKHYGKGGGQHRSKIAYRRKDKYPRQEDT